MKKLALLSLSIAALAAGSGAALAAPPAPSGANPAERKMVCHITGSATNPVVYIYVPSQSKAPRKACDAPPVELVAPAPQQPEAPTVEQPEAPAAEQPEASFEGGF